tara:strand:+ start:2226 stop:3443 length:1218 start_codon:yes stop_codon:yes gene_type:complete
MRLINKYFYNIFIVISISIILRLLLLNTYGDSTLENEWGVIFNNLKNFGVLAYRSFEDYLVPSVYMPPLYVYFIFLIDVFSPEILNLVQSILITQILLSAITTYFFYKINFFLFNKKLSIISSYIFSLFPLNIYSSLQISSISLQIFLSVIFLYLILKILSGNDKIKICLFLSFISGLTVLLRGEFIIIYFFTVVYLIYYKKLNFYKVAVIILVTILTTSPYLVRNYMVFEKITVTKSFGYNLWKGNNIDATVEGSETNLAFKTDKIKEKIDVIEKNNLYEFNYDKIFLESSLKFIDENKLLFFKRYIKKVLTFSFFNLNSNYPGYYHPLNILSLTILSIIFMIGIISIISKKKSIFLNYFLLNLIVTIGIFAIFFILPRYKLIILPVQLILINFWLSKYFKKGV